MKFEVLEVENGLNADFNVQINASSRITDIDIMGEVLKIKCLDSEFDDQLDVYNFKVFVIGEKGNYGSLGVNDDIVNGYTYYGKKFHAGSYLYYFGKQIDRVKA